MNKSYNFAKTLNEISPNGVKGVSDCHNFGITWGCHPHCPTFVSGGCEVAAENLKSQHFLDDMDDEEVEDAKNIYKIMNLSDKALDIILDHTSSPDWEDVLDLKWSSEDVQEILIKALEVRDDWVRIEERMPDKIHEEKETQFLVKGYYKLGDLVGKTMYLCQNLKSSTFNRFQSRSAFIVTHWKEIT